MKPFSYVLTTASLLVLTLSIGCRPARMSIMGRWSGEFNVLTVDKSASLKDPKRNELAGFIQFYGTEHRCTMRLDGEQVGIDVTGNWAEEKDSLVVTVTNVKIDDMGGQDLRNPNKAYLPAADIQAGLSKPLVLRISPDKKTLHGVLMTIGPLEGKFSFTKDAQGIG